ncbi:MAG: tetratricopeptide repeat protein [Bacteroidetes bacterium]|nr:tetratricopeptide repeat protein [Bacteroidota bacterium]
MADIKDEPKIEHTNIEQPEVVTESSDNETKVKVKKPIDPTLENMQAFYLKNKNLVNYVGGGLLLIIAAFSFFKFYYLPEQEAEASNEMFWAQNYFEKDSFAIALNGGKMVLSPDGQKQMQGFLQIADNYGVTKSGNLAHYYAGVCLLRTGKFDQAIEQLGQFNSSDAIVGPIAIGAIGDCNMELNKIDEAINYYLKAADKSRNSYTTPMFLKKAAFAYEQKGNFQEAINNYERIKREYGKSDEGREVEREIARLKAKGNL